MRVQKFVFRCCAMLGYNRLMQKIALLLLGGQAQSARHHIVIVSFIIIIIIIRAMAQSHRALGRASSSDRCAISFS